jgi:hypothetical protein
MTTTKIKATVRERGREIKAKSSASIVRRLEDFDNLSGEGVVDGSVLVYLESQEKWQPTTVLNKQNVDGGEF